MSKDTGGAAFPVPHSIDGNWVREPIEQFSGMTLRDYFAAKAMQGFMSNEGASFIPSQEQFAAGITWVDNVAKEAYEIADAMLKERAK